MAISPTTDWSKIRYIMLLVFGTNVLLSSIVANGLSTSGKQKRHLFREHLLPERGGKIPESAFRLDRVSLNKLNKEGFYTSDGDVVEQNNPYRHHHEKLPFPKTLKITYRPSDSNRYVVPEGRSHNTRTVDTTYIIREPIKLNIKPHFNTNNLPIVPYSSLMLLKNFQRKRSAAKANFSGGDYQAEEIFKEFAPALRKLHESDFNQKLN